MSRSLQQSYALLSHEDKADEDEGLYQPRNVRTSGSQGLLRTKGLIVVLLVLSIATNILLAVSLTFSGWRMKAEDDKILQSSYVDMSPFAGLSRQTSYKFPYSEGYGPEVENHTLADKVWEAIDIDPGVVAVPLDWAREHNLAETQPFPWDDSKGIYVVNAYHTLHCLKLLHKLVYEAHHGWPLTREIHHALHCIDGMRKDAMCNADDFLLATPPSRQYDPGPRGQNRVCKNWDALVGWANEHNACYQHVTDDEVAYAKEHKEIERFTNCPPGSPYREKMERYFHLKGMEIKPMPSIES